MMVEDILPHVVVDCLPPPRQLWRLSAARHLQGRLIGQMEALGFNVKEEAILRTLTDDILKSSEIEGEKLNVDQVRSSVARRLGMEIGELKRADRYIEGVVAYRPPKKIGRALSDREIQPFHERRVQFRGVLGFAQHLFESPRGPISARRSILTMRSFLRVLMTSRRDRLAQRRDGQLFCKTRSRPWRSGPRR
jgi:hypothetical protein